VSDIVSTCRECGAPYTAKQLEAFNECIKCGEPFLIGRESDKRPPLDLTGFRRLAMAAVEQGNGPIALELLDLHLPSFLALFGEMARAIAALSGECRCRSARIIGAKPLKHDPCPHVRARRALHRGGFTQQDIETLRKQIPLCVR
jgi:hypothetical protein